MYIAVADMAKPDDFKIRVAGIHHILDRFEKLWHFGNHGGNIVFVGRPAGNGFGDIFAQAPQVFKLLQ